MDSRVVTLKSKEDMVPIQKLILELSSMQKPPPLEIRIEADFSDWWSLDWGNLLVGTPLDLQVDGGGHRLQGMKMRVEGRHVHLKSLRMDGDKREGCLLQLVASEEILLSDIVVGNTAPQARNSGGRIPTRTLQLSAAAPGVKARAERVLIVDVPASDGVYIGSRGGGAGFSEVQWEEGRAGAVAAPLFSLGEVNVFSAHGTRILGSGTAVRAMPSTALLEEPAVLPEDAALLAQWRAELAAPGPASR